MAAKADADEGLKRLGGGRWQTRDGRFTIEPQSGTWAVVDGEQTDELGLPLVRGPFGSLTAAKAAIETARSSAAPESPLAARSTDRPKASTRATTTKAGAAATEAPQQEEAAGTRPPKTPAKPTPPAEPAWLADLKPDDRRRARRLMEALAAAGASDPEGIARRDVAGGVPATAGWAASRAVAALGPDATPAAVAKLLADGRDDELDVRWRLVDGDDRPIVLDLGGRARRS